MTDRTAFSEISGKEDSLARYTEIFGNFLPGTSVSFVFPTRISQIFRRMVRFSEIQQFPDCIETFPGNIRAICRRFEIFVIFG